MHILHNPTKSDKISEILTNTANLSENKIFIDTINEVSGHAGSTGGTRMVPVRTCVRTVGLNLNFPVNYSKISVLRHPNVTLCKGIVDSSCRVLIRESLGI